MMSSQIFDAAPLCSGLCRLEAQPRLQALLGPIPCPGTHSRGWGESKADCPSKAVPAASPARHSLSTWITVMHPHLNSPYPAVFTRTCNGFLFPSPPPYSWVPIPAPPAWICVSCSPLRSTYVTVPPAWLGPGISSQDCAFCKCQAYLCSLCPQG